MVAKTTNKVKYFLFIASIIFLSYCANQLPPGGGDEDTTPPEITTVYPPDGTINFSEKYFKLSFSEYIDKRSFREAIFISPTIEGELEISWTGRTATVNFPKGLRDDFTYVVTIGTDVVDLNNRNRMAQSFTFLFSTGDEIDRRIISGRVYDKDADGVMIFAYKVLDDTTDYIKLKPDYVSQVGKDGNFNLNGLAESDYRVFAVKDQLRDMLFQSETDKIGIPFSDVSLRGNDSTFTGLNFFLMSADTMKPRLVSAVMTDNRHILVTTSKPVDTSIIAATNFSIIDSTENTEFGSFYAFKGNTKPDELVIVVEDFIPLQNDLHLRADRLIDLTGNLFTDDYTRITISERNDTSAIKIFKNYPTDLRRVDFLNPVIRFYCDDAFNSDDVKIAVTVTDTLNNIIRVNFNFPDDATVEIRPFNNLQSEKDYFISFDFSKIPDAAGNITDTTVVYRVRTISGLEFTGASGTIIADSLSNLFLVLSSVEREDLSYQIPADEKINFSFDRVESGKYRLWGFYDLNENQKYNFGYPSPLEYSERFFVYKDTLELRPRWSVTDLVFEVK